MPLHHDVVTLLELMQRLDQPPLETQDPDSARAARRALLRPPTEECFDSDARLAYAIAAEAIVAALR